MGWSQWGPCSVTCGLGIQTKSRECRGGEPGDGFCNLDGEGHFQAQVCAEEKCCTADWTEWSECCVEDGENVQVQVRGNRCTRVWLSNYRACEGTPSTTDCSHFVRLFKMSDADKHNLEYLAEGSGD